MAPHLYVETVPAEVYDLTVCTPTQLDHIEYQASEVAERVRNTRKGSSIIATLITRHENRQFVRCTNQSVKITACARYEPAASEFDLSMLSLVCFVGVVTYLPIPLIKSLVSNKSVIAWAERIWDGMTPDTRWATYHASLVGVNPVWASLLLQEVQAHTEGPIIHQVTAEEISMRMQSGQDNSSMLASRTAEHPEPLRNEALLLRVIKAKSLAWGTGNVTTVDSVVHLADLYISQSRYTEARRLALQAFRDWKSTETEQTIEMFRLLKVLAEVDCQLEDI